MFGEHSPLDTAHGDLLHQWLLLKCGGVATVHIRHFPDPCQLLSDPFAIRAVTNSRRFGIRNAMRADLTIRFNGWYPGHLRRVELV